MVTTNRLIPIEAFGSDPPELVHLTGSFQVVARVTSEGVAASGSPGTRPAGGPARVEVRCDAVRVRGVGLKSGARYEARGSYQCINDTEELPVPLRLVSAFELLRRGSGNPTATRLLLIVRLSVTVQIDGQAMVGIEDPLLLSCEG